MSVNNELQIEKIPCILILTFIAKIDWEVKYDFNIPPILSMDEVNVYLKRLLEASL